MVKYKLIENAFLEAFSLFLESKNKAFFNDSLKSMTEICDYLKKENIKLNTSTLEIIVRHPLLRKVFLNMIDEYREFIISDELDKVISDLLVICLLKSFVDLNNIKISRDLYSDSVDSYTKTWFSNYLDSLEYKELSREEEIAYFKKYNTFHDREIRNFLIANNLKLVSKVAKRYIKYDFNTFDIIAEGNIGLMVAVEKFDVTKGTRFSTYAYHCIDSYIKSYITNNCKQIRIPVWANSEIEKIKEINRKFEINLGREATTKEIAEIMDFDLEKVNVLLTVIKREEKMERVDDLLSKGIGSTALINFITADENVEKDVIDRVYHDELDELLKRALTPIERDIVISQVNFDGKGFKSYTELAHKYNCTSQWIKCLYDKALLRLKVVMLAEELTDNHILKRKKK